MPYNNAPISPEEELSGTSVLPLARVKKIVAADEDIAQCSNSAAFVISVATEMFVRQLTEQAHNVVKSERKPRRNIQYKDLATAVARIDNLEFLSDVIPRTTTFKQFKEKKARETANGTTVQAGQMTLDGKQPAEQSETPVDRVAQTSLPVGPNGLSSPEGFLPPVSPTSATHRPLMPALNGSPIVDRTISSPEHVRPANGDVEMTG